RVAGQAAATVSTRGAIATVPDAPALNILHTDGATRLVQPAVLAVGDASRGFVFGVVFGVATRRVGRAAIRATGIAMRLVTRSRQRQTKKGPRLLMERFEGRADVRVKSHLDRKYLDVCASGAREAMIEDAATQITSRLLADVLRELGSGAS